MPIKIQKLDHFVIYVTDLARSEEFYMERLGMKVRMRIGLEQVVLECGDTLLALMAKPDLRTPVEPDATDSPLGRAHFAVNVSTADWNEARKELAAAGVPTSKPIDWGDHDCFYLSDPDGNMIELMSWREAAVNVSVNDDKVMDRDKGTTQ
jgi:catechol 2,3-dioxygenase-like lactoylglutathione lyase family enzyme